MIYELPEPLQGGFFVIGELNVFEKETKTDGIRYSVLGN